MNGQTEQDRWVNSGLVPQAEYRKRRDARDRDDGYEDEPKLTVDEERELRTVQYLKRMLDAGVKARKPYETFDLCWDAYIGDHWPRGMATWRAKITMNKLRSLAHFMQAVMTDQKPMFTVDPVVPGSDATAKLMQKLTDREWDESQTQDKLSLATLYGIIFGTGILKSGYNSRGAGGRGEHTTSAVLPYRIFVDELATCVEDARFIIHIEPRSIGWICENYPERAQAVRRMRNKRVLESETAEHRDFVREGTAAFKGQRGRANPERLNVDGIVTTVDLNVTRDATAASDFDRSDDWEEMIEVAEFWFRDESTEPFQRPKRKNGELVYEEEIDEDGTTKLEADGTYEAISEITGLPFTMVRYKAKKTVVMEGWRRAKYPNGRLAVMAGPVLLTDIPNPFACGFPFATFKNVDVGTFWGQSELLPLRDMNFGVERIISQVYDNLNLTGNPSWLVDTASGINLETLRSRPGLTIPTNNLDKSMKPLPVQPMPEQFMQLAGMLKSGIGEVSGVSDSMTSGGAPANTSFATVDMLAESSSAPIRLKTRNMEHMIWQHGKNKLALIQQFDNGDRPVRERDEADDGSPWVPLYEDGDVNGRVIGVVPPARDIEVRFQTYTNGDLQGQLEFGVKPDSSLSTSPSGLKNWYMQLWDKKLIDIQSFHEKFKMDGWQLIVQRMQAMSAAGGSKKKPGPAPAPGAARKGGGPRPPAPSSQMPARHDLNALR